MKITQELINLNTDIRDKQQAIEAVATLLVQAGKVKPEYLQGMYDRETQANTYLGNFVAIPHGTPNSRQFINETAIAIIQIPRGIIWGEQEEVVKLVIGIAASGDEHLKILRRLTRLFNESGRLDELTKTTDKNVIIQALSSEINAQHSTTESLPHSQFIEIPNPLGFHARPATNLTKVVKQLGAQVFLVREDGTRADASKMMAILSLGLTKNSRISVESDNSEALAQVIVAIKSGLGDDLNAVIPNEETAPINALWQPEGKVTAIHGICAAQGLVIGKVHHYTPQNYTITNQRSAITPLEEAKRLQNAIEVAKKSIQETIERVRDRVSADQLAIFDAHLELLTSESLLEPAAAAIYRGATAETAYFNAANNQVAELERLSDPILSTRAIDLKDIRDRVIRVLLGVKEPILNFSEDTILCAQDLTPSDTAKIDPSKVTAFITENGGPSSHSSILARGLGIAAVVGVSNLARLNDGDTVIVDANAGAIYINPTTTQISSANTIIHSLNAADAEIMKHRYAIGTTEDGKRIEISVNANNASAAQKALEFGAEGVGLMRTEFLYMESSDIPSEDMQYKKYSELAEVLGEKPLIIRTLDIGADKEVPYLNLVKEENASLGIRGIRLCLARPDLFLPQIRAICRAAQTHKNIKVMFPMIATLQDWKRAKEQFQAIAEEFNVKIPLGIMIEIPSAALLADKLAEEVDFFSIGTNDLTQYTLAMDRMNPNLARQADPLNPAVLKMIDLTARAAETHNIWVGVCGGAAGDPVAAAIFVGLGVTELSVSSREVAKIKHTLRGISSRKLTSLARQALSLEDANQVRTLIQKELI